MTISKHHGDSARSETVLIVLSFTFLSKLDGRRHSPKDALLRSLSVLLQRHKFLLQLTATENLDAPQKSLILFKKNQTVEGAETNSEYPIPSAITPGTPERESQA
jgi:hypothetical protein